MAGKRRRFTVQFKARLIRAALREDKMLTELRQAMANASLARAAQLFTPEVYRTKLLAAFGLVAR
ncbi:MAG: hypothetical protein HQ546_02645 [Planctomycetes bacterium]|nr:hypothetical protein [Planctomycetota bacterium]